MRRSTIRRAAALEDLPNIGKAVAADLRIIGIDRPAQLRRRNPYALYEQLNRVTGDRHDPCVLDTFIAAVRFVEGGPARPWWAYTAERKRALAMRKRSRRRHPRLAGASASRTATAR